MKVTVGIADVGAALRSCQCLEDAINEIAAYYTEFDLFHEGVKVTDSILRSVQKSGDFEVFLTKEFAEGQRYGVLEAFVDEDGESKHVASIYIDEVAKG